MLISHEYQFIYLKTIKTAGTSVEIYFERFCVDPASYGEECQAKEAHVSDWGVIGYRGATPEGQTWYNHMPASRVRELIGHERWNRYFKFCVVRNPFDKLVSYFWFNQPEPVRRDLGRAAFSVVRDAFINWARNTQYPIDRQIFMIDGMPVMEYFIRFENMNRDIECVCRKLQLPWEPARLGRYKGDYRLRNEHFSMYYDAQTKSLVQNEYAWELEYFGYAC